MYLYQLSGLDLILSRSRVRQVRLKISFFWQVFIQFSSSFVLLLRTWAKLYSWSCWWLWLAFQVSQERAWPNFSVKTTNCRKLKGSHMKMHVGLKMRKCATISICRLGMVDLSILMQQNDFAALNLSSFRVQPCWFILYWWRAETGWLVRTTFACAIHAGHDHDV